MAEEKQEVSDRHYQVMKNLQDLRADVKYIFDDTINSHYDYPPQTREDWERERNKLRDDLREVQKRIDRTLQGL